MRYVSLFSGIEAASVAWEPLGWEPVAFSEIDPFCCRLLAERFPGVPNLGDIRTIEWKELDLGAVDLVVGGSPCQSFSIAGGRESLDGESRLMFEYIRAVDEIRPAWVVWENVPGVLNTKDDAFGQLIDSLQDIGYGSVAWRVLDAQFFGVAQRRRRVFVVGHLGEGGAAPAVLFERESVRGDSLTSREKRAQLASSSGGGAQGEVWSLGSAKANSCMDEDLGQTVVADHDHQIIAFAQNTRDEVRLQGDGDIAGALSAQAGMKQTTYIIQGAGSTSLGSHGAGIDVDVCYTLNLIDRHAVVFEGRPYVLKEMAGKPGGGKGALIGEDVAFTLSTGNDQTVISSSGGDVVGPLRARDSKGVGSQYVEDGKCIIDGSSSGYVVRRLTPMECERLQGFPDGWTDMGSDSQRYKALGNSMAVPVMRWIGERIEFVEGVMDGLE